MLDLLFILAEWAEEHPIKSMFFITIPLCILTSITTVLLAKELLRLL